MKKQDVWIILILFVLAGAWFAWGRSVFLPSVTGPMPSIDSPEAIPQENPQRTEFQTLSGTPGPAATLPPAQGYLLVTVGDVVFAPYPLLEARDLPIVQVDGQQNLVHLTPQGFVMTSATCENQDCVGQGEVTLQNRDMRILGNLIVCLPNQVMLELLTPEEAERVWNHAQESD